MRFLKYFLLLLLVVIVAASIYLASLDGTYDVKRSRFIPADPEVVFNDLNDYRNWADWGPWYEQDSTIVATYADNTVGVGGSYSWTSMDGEGEMRRLVSAPNERIESEILFKTPFGDMGSEVYWILEKKEEGTDLTWGMKGEMPFMTRFMASSMEEQMGPMQERGLELFEASITKKMQVYSIEEKGVTDYSGGFYLYVTASSQISDMNPRFREMMEQVKSYAEKNSIRLTGPPFAIYHRFDQEQGTTMFSVGFPVSERVIVESDSEVVSGYMKRGSYYKVVLTGSYEHSKEAWESAVAGASKLGAYDAIENGEPFEIYVKMIDDTPNPAEWVTEIFIPVKLKLSPGA